MSLDNEGYPRYRLHGGCYGCTQQDIHGVGFCIGCQYFDADWNLPNLNNEPPNETKKMRDFLKLVHSSVGTRRIKR